ncbi:non-SMC condensin II complex subunit D3 [Phyllostomus discolor]|uniref:Non-SMC condensin II complex subunit D3 n=1 Tax=Phyllostomus discolor TaxID=89673 RepID=A0A834DJJ0_9CHIR|nr:non-SMC condensin II complex subunit D3 [Phyllostomus discolor]
MPDRRLLLWKTEQEHSRNADSPPSGIHWTQVPSQPFANPAVSPCSEPIAEVTFEAGVSYIGTPRTPFPVKEKNGAQDQGNDILCLSLPDKPPPQPQQWNVKSPARNKDNPVPSRRSLRKSPLKTAN